MLATIEKITEILPIVGADRIELAKIQGYQSVINKNLYQVGDLVAFIQPDTMMPRREYNKFLWPKIDPSPEGAPIRLRTCKFKKELSMGLIVSLSHLPQGQYIENQDVTDILGITKYESHSVFNVNAAGSFPSWLRKSDETNILSKIGVFEELKGKDCYITIKNDGSSAKFSLKDGNFQVFSRSLEVKHDNENPWSIIASKLDIESKLRKINRNICLCAELIGPKMNGNKMGLTELDAKIYDIWDIDRQVYLGYKDMINILQIIGLESVELFEKGMFNYDLIKDLQSKIDVLRYKNGEFIEGVVIRPIHETYSLCLRGRMSVKLINQNFAAKHL